MKEEISTALIDQVAIEFRNANQYQTLGVALEQQGLVNAAKWLLRQSVDERAHGDKIVEYLNDNQVRFAVPAIDAVKYANGPAEAMQIVYDAEVSNKVNFEGLTDMANEARDNTLVEFLGWFLLEQLEEISTAWRILQALKTAGTPIMWDLWVKETYL